MKKTARYCEFRAALENEMKTKQQFISSRRLALEVARPVNELTQRAAYVRRAQLARQLRQWGRQGATLPSQPTR